MTGLNGDYADIDDAALDKVVPETVTIKGPSEAKVNETVSLECTTSNSNPEARIIWNVDSREVRENASRITTSPNGGWVTASNLTTTVRNTGRNLTVTCHAVVAELAKTVTQMKTIIVACKLLLSRRSAIEPMMS